ncbi:capsular polysaccharide synthesis protein [Fusicatenibacter saccharivorans]|uniref:capsular polysaccharide synthesis protein n=1 Tax=Fusicatenibacter saccharivorans TaxID=1150298 RepID=UPI003F927E22
MKQIIRKIKNNIGIIKKEWYQDIQTYSRKLAITRLESTIFRLIRMNDISAAFANKKNVIVMEYLKSNYGYLFQKYQEYRTDDVARKGSSKNAPIWVCWFDGIENAPPLVKRCFKSICQHANGHPVHIITWENCTDYVEIPQILKDKIANGEIGLAHYSDVLRVCLLEKYGGLWLDATIFCNRDLPEEYFQVSLFTCRSDRPTPGCVSANRWTTFCLGGSEGNILFQALKDFFLCYWSKESCAIDYLFFDDAIELALEMVPQIKQDINNVPTNNIRRDELILRFYDPWSELAVKDLVDSDTVLFKLGYREKRFLQEYDSQGRPTVYFAFINELF